MPQFGERSQKNLDECHPKLQQLFKAVIEHYDCAVIEGHRGEDEQNALFHAGKSKLQFPDGNHNKKPSLAVDVVPWKVDWNNSKRFYHFAGFVKGMASLLDIKIRWGGDWDGDFDFEDQSFHDLPHFELMEY